MIHGVGVDICDMERIKCAFERHGNNFARKILTNLEISVWRERMVKNEQRGIDFLATRFSAKEAISKAFGSKWPLPKSWQHCSVLNASGGEPKVILHEPLLSWCQDLKLNIHLSLSDERHQVLSFCVIEAIKI